MNRGGGRHVESQDISGASGMSEIDPHPVLGDPNFSSENWRAG